MNDAKRMSERPAAGFGTRLQAAFDAHGHLCVGIDPHDFLLEKWGLAATAAGVREFGLRVVAAAAGTIGMVKPQIAFFERYGSAGYAALEDVLAAARAAGLLVIADVKRGDVGTSVEAYGQAWLTPGSPIEADAMTISAFQGVGSIAAPIALAQNSGKGLFVLAATSNPEAAVIQTAQIQSARGDADGRWPRSVARAIIDDVLEANLMQADEAIGSIGVVLGATLDLAAYGIDLEHPARPALPVLAPGFGHQGTRIADAARIYGALLPAVIVTESRSVLSAGPDRIAETMARRAAEVGESLG